MTRRSSFPEFDQPSVCPVCMAHHEAMGGMTGQRAPRDGDLNFCVVCHGVSIYDTSVPTLLRHPTDEELAVIAKDPRVKEIQEAMGVVSRKVGPLKGDYFPKE